MTGMVHEIVAGYDGSPDSILGGASGRALMSPGGLASSSWIGARLRPGVSRGLCGSPGSGVSAPGWPGRGGGAPWWSAL
jgi:hypothetical protein